MEIAERLRCIKPSATLSVNAKTLELKAQGVDVISLAVGEPDFPTPVHVCDAACAAIREGFTRYTAVPGIPALRKAVGGYYDRQYGICPPPEAVIVSNGGKHALYNLMQALLNAGDEVLIPAPYWVSYPDMVSLAQATPVIVRAGVELGFKVTPAMLDAACTPRTKMLILNSPSNPTGAVYGQEEFDAIMQWAMDRGLFVISDEIYDQLVFAPAVMASAMRWWQKFPDRVAVCNGVAKSFAMTGWRVGYTVAHPDLVKKLATLQGQCTSNVCSVAQKAALAALEGSYDCVRSMNAAFRRRRDMAYAVVDSWEKARCPRPDGAFYIFADVSGYFREGMRGSAAVCTRLLEEAHVALVPGVAFGDDNCIRFSYAVDDQVLASALEKIGAVLHSR
ncbi:MAG: pyridoxal phosphate-dependent aminotransferase [Desulfovibrionaceae bacterium]|nr:pyridoxal phosphate-dependent aminotransferase [Desulfovibrionaceae bacterium]